MFKKLTDIERFIAERNIVTVDLKYSNLFGGWHHLSIPASHAAAERLEKGIGFDSSSTPGFKALESGDMVLVPEPSTAFIDPFWDVPTLSLICNIAEADSKVQFQRDPRAIARRAEAYLKSTGIADRSQWGPEFEFYLFDPIDHPEDEAISNLEASSHDPGFFRNGAYHLIPPQDRYFNLRNEITQHLESVGVEVHYHHHEVGCPTQQEIEVVLGSLTRMGDVSMMIKYFVKMAADAWGISATFMPKPLYRQPGSGMHFHQHLFKGDKPLFYDARGYAGLSKTALSYIAGILLHGASLLALTNPATNSYKRLVPGYEAPVNLFFSLANRSAAIRIPKYTQEPMEKRIEFRPPDATCNPYIAMAAMLMAGIDGIRKNLDPTELGFGPFDENLFAPENEELKKKIKGLPASLDLALKALEEDHEFLLEGDVFSQGMIETWIDYKVQQEFLEVRNRPHPHEIALYYNC